MDVILNLIQSLGFPSAMCIGLCYYIKYITDKNSSDLEGIRESYRTEMKEIRDSIIQTKEVLLELTLLLRKEK